MTVFSTPEFEVDIDELREKRLDAGRTEVVHNVYVHSYNIFTPEFHHK